jgi:uncharacterized membrane protein YphA (DoxX/SURF4 family)
LKAQEHVKETTVVPPSKALNWGLWLAQVLLALTFAGTGVWKLVTPIAELSAMIPWAGQVSPGLLYATAAFDLLGGIGILVPFATRIEPRLTAPAAIGCAALQVSAIIFHVSRGETASIPFNLLLVLLSLFVAWGRRRG